MSDLTLAQRYAPIIHFDAAETIPLQAVGYTVFRGAALMPWAQLREEIPGRICAECARLVELYAKE